MSDYYYTEHTQSHILSHPYSTNIYDLYVQRFCVAVHFIQKLAESGWGGFCEKLENWKEWGKRKKTNRKEQENCTAEINLCHVFLGFILECFFVPRTATGRERARSARRLPHLVTLAGVDFRPISFVAFFVSVCVMHTITWNGTIHHAFSSLFSVSCCFTLKMIVEQCII